MRTYFLALVAVCCLVSCTGGGGGGGLTTSPSTTPPTDGSTDPGGGSGGSGGGGGTPAPDEYTVPAPVPQLAFDQVPSSTLYARDADAIPLGFTLNNPTGETPKCNWFMEIPPQTLMPSGIAKQQFGTVNGNCDPFVHNQTNQLNYRYWVYISAGGSTLEYQWDVTYVSSSVNTALAILGSTAEATYRIFDSKLFTVEVDDRDRDAVCSWKIDGVEVATNCLNYTASAASGTRTLTFEAHDSSSNVSKTWTLKPAAKMTALTPTAANVVNGASQVFTASVDDPNSSGATCKFFVDSALVQSGNCSYTHTGDGSAHVIDAQLVYGAEVAGTLSAYAYGAVNNPVSFDSATPTQGVMYLAPGETSNTFGVTYTDVDGDAQFKWYLGGVEVDCDVSSACTYTNPLKNGIRLDSFAGSSVVVKVVLSDGQYSASKTWLAHIDRAEINESLPAGIKCNASGAEFWIYGRGFESSDVITLQNQNIVLTKLYTSDNAVKVKLPQSVSPGMQKVRIVKAYNSNQSPSGTTGSTVETAFGFVTFTSASQYCQ